MGWKAPLTIAVCCFFKVHQGLAVQGLCFRALGLYSKCCVSCSYKYYSQLTWLRNPSYVMPKNSPCISLSPVLSSLCRSMHFAIGKAILYDLKLHKSCPSALSSQSNPCNHGLYSKPPFPSGWRGERERLGNTLHAGEELWPVTPFNCAALFSPRLLRDMCWESKSDR